MIARTTLVLRAVELRGSDMSRPQWYQFAQWPDSAQRLSRRVVLVPLLQSILSGMQMEEFGRHVIYGVVIIAMLLVYGRGRRHSD
jgi:hypothetical protein